jgi:hypothetical protein
MFEFLKKIRFKKKSMDNLQEIDIELLDNELKIFSYKWTKGDHDGKICEYENVFKDPTTGIVWVNFTDGTRINYELLNQYMMQLDKNNTSYSGSVSNAPVIEQSLTRGQSPVRNVMLPDNANIRTESSNPIVSLLEKQKPNWVNVDISLKLNLPTKSLYNVLTSSFEDADNEIIEFVVKDLDLEIIKESLRINIKEIYKGTNGNVRKAGNKDDTEK